MFAVTGWNLTSAGPRAQTGDSNNSAKKHTNNPKKRKPTRSASDTNAIPLSNKRSLAAITETEPAAVEAPRLAQDTPAKNTVVTADNVLALYEKVIEGKAPKRFRDRKRKKERKGKAMREPDPAKKEEPPGSTTPAEGREKKRSKPYNEEQSETAQGPRSKADGPSPKKRKKKGKQISATTSTISVANAPAPAPAPVTASLSSVPALTPLQQKMRAKLTSARFRHINEILYTTPSPSSLSLFTSQPDMYTEYHAGFRRQVEVWPENPVDIFIKTLQDRSKIKFERGHNRKWNSTEKGILPLPRDRDEGWCTVADLGCGDAKIAETLNHQKPRGKGKVKVLSYDLQASTKDVTVADIAHLPLEPESVDVVIFCLALMGTNFLEFIEEAHRILRWRGELWIAEIKSRFNRPTSTKGITVGSKNGRKKDEDSDKVNIEPIGEMLDIESYKPFIGALAKRGFAIRGQVDAGNKMFVRMDFVKIPERERRIRESDDEGMKEQGESWKAKKKKSKFLDEEADESKILKPCVYRLR